MASAAHGPAPIAANPLDIVEQIVLANDWAFDRLGDDEVAAEVSGRGCVYHLWFAWRPERAALQFSCTFPVHVPDRRRAALYPLLAMINERLWIGHFDVSSEGGMVMFRQAMALRGGPGVSAEQVHDLVEAALDECTRYYPAFQYVIWGGKSPSEAMDLAMVQTVGEA